MTSFLKKYSTFILLSLLLTLLILAWVFPSLGMKLGIPFLLVSFLIASLVMLERHTNTYRKGKITLGIFIRNAVMDISGTFLIMLFAGLLGSYAAEVTTQQIGNDLLRIAAGIVVGLVVGLGVGMLAKKTVRRLVKVSR
jgi:hypothetical protein